MKATDRTIAAALGLTYEGFTGDYSTTNYTSGRMGRMDVDPQIQNWQQNIMVAQVCDGFGRWIAEAIDDVAAIAPADWELNWTPPVRPVVDPTKDFKAAETALRNGLKSKRGQIREFGGDPDAVEREIEEERAWANERDLVFASDAGASATATSDTAPADDADDDKKNGGRT